MGMKTGVVKTGSGTMPNPVNSFLGGMNATSAILQRNRNYKRDERLFDMKMDAYQRDEDRDRRDEANRAKKRKVASDIANVQSGNYNAEDVARLDPEAGFKLGSFTDAFDEKKQGEAMNYVMPLFDKVAKGGALAENEREPIWAAGGALTVTGVLAPDLTGIKEQVAVAPALKKKIVSLSEAAKGQLMGKQTQIDEHDDPELFAQFSKAFPAVGNSSKAFKDGSGRVVEFYIDATGVDKIQDARVVAVLEGVNPKTGKVYRAPMSRRRSSDPDDPLASRTLGELYAQVDFAEKTSQGLLASLAGLDDAEAQRVIDNYRGETKRLVDEKRKLAARGNLADALSGLIGFTKVESAAYKKAVMAGATPKAAADFLIKKKAGPKVEVTWRDNVEIDGKPYQVAYDKNLRQLLAIPEYVKPEKGSGTGGGSGSSGGGKQAALPSHIMELFKNPEQYDENGFQVAGKSIDKERLNKFVAFKSRYGHDMTYEDAYAQFMKQGSSSGGGDPKDKKGDPVTEADIKNIPEAELVRHEKALSLVVQQKGQEKAMAALEEIKNVNPALYVALKRRFDESKKQTERDMAAKKLQAGIAKTHQRPYFQGMMARPTEAELKEAVPLPQRTMAPPKQVFTPEQRRATSLYFNK